MKSGAGHGDTMGKEGGGYYFFVALQIGIGIWCVILIAWVILHNILSVI